MSKSEILAKIEFQETVTEAHQGEFQPVRFTRVKYRDSPNLHVDIRKYQRGYDENGNYVFHPTKIGVRIKEKEFQKVIEKFAITPKSYVHPKIIDKCFLLFQSGEFESAVFQAFKMIEVTIRELIDGIPEDIGVKLIRKAFHPINGQLTDYQLPKVEREAFANYLAGAFALYKNPSSHREVKLEASEALERLVVASDLLKKIELSGPF